MKCLDLLFKSKKESKKTKIYLTLEDLLTSSGSFPERSKSEEITTNILNNARVFLNNVNLLLEELEIQKGIKVSSGFRPSKVNANISGAAKKSLHQKCLAVDIIDDKDQTLYNLIRDNFQLLKKYDLWMENGNYTRGKYTNWVHLDMGDRWERSVRIFIP